jgi:hypothetical protein
MAEDAEQDVDSGSGPDDEVADEILDHVSQVLEGAQGNALLGKPIPM